MKYEVVWFVGKFCYTKTVKDIRMALALAENKLSEKEVDEIEIVKGEELDDE